MIRRKFDTFGFNKPHIVLNLLCLSFTFFATILYFLNIWYQTPHKRITYSANVVGCIGSPTSKVYLGMDYGDDADTSDSLGAILFISHKYRKRSPYLFRGIVDPISQESRKDRYRNFYAPLANYNLDKCDSISTVYCSKITISSSLYDVVNNTQNEKWTEDKLLTIRIKKPQNSNRNTITSESWFYLSRLPNSYPDEYGEVILCSGLNNDFDNFKPNWHSKGDLSKLDCQLSLKLDDLHGCDTIEINTVGPFDLKSISIIPDSLSFNRIIFYNQDKIKAIRKKGLHLYAEFPEASKLQNFRMAILLIVLPFVLTWIIYLIKKECGYLKRWLLQKIRVYLNKTD